MGLIGEAVAALVVRHLKAARWLSWGVISAYDPATHRATVTLEDGMPTGALRVLTPHLGMAHSLDVGTQCVVGLVAGIPLAILGFAHSDTDPVPDAAQSIQGDVFIGGQLTVTGPVSLSLGLTLPTPTAALRGTLLAVGPTPDATAGTADTLMWCGQRADGTLVWTVVATAT